MREILHDEKGKRVVRVEICDDFQRVRESSTPTELALFIPRHYRTCYNPLRDVSMLRCKIRGSIERKISFICATELRFNLPIEGLSQYFSIRVARRPNRFHSLSTGVIERRKKKARGGGGGGGRTGGGKTKKEQNLLRSRHFSRRDGE